MLYVKLFKIFMIKGWGFYCIKINSRYCFKIYKFLFLFVCGDFEV